MLPYKVSGGSERAKGLARAQNGGQYQLIHGKAFICGSKKGLIKTITAKRDFTVSILLVA